MLNYKNNYKIVIPIMSVYNIFLIRFLSTIVVKQYISNSSYFYSSLNMTIDSIKFQILMNCRRYM